MAASSAQDERAHWLAFSIVPGLGPVGFAQLVREHGSAAAAWAAGPRAFEGLPRLATDGADTYARLRRRGVGAIAAGLEAATRESGGRIVTPLDRGYPAMLRSVEPRPFVLHIAGDPDAFAVRSVAIVGTRRPSGYGLTTTVELADELARAEVAVVSGLAIGIDGAAHRAALAAGGRTIAVLPSPLDRIYPPRHRSLAAEIVRRGGALVTELAVGRQVGRPDFARRNRLIAALSHAVVIAEAPDRSGALLTAAAAMALGRELYAVPGPITSPTSRGCNRLIADHEATIVTSAASLLQQIGLARGEVPPTIDSLSEAEGRVLAKLLERPGSIEELLDRAGASAAQIASALTLLETRGLVSSFGGATFHPTLAARRLAHLV